MSKTRRSGGEFDTPPDRRVAAVAAAHHGVLGGIVRPEVNPALVLAGRSVVPDFLWRDRRLVLEADGDAWHDGKLAREDDAERQAILEAHGYRVLGVTWDQAIRRPCRTLARLSAAGAPGTGRR